MGSDDGLLGNEKRRNGSGLTPLKLIAGVVIGAVILVPIATLNGSTKHGSGATPASGTAASMLSNAQAYLRKPSFGFEGQHQVDADPAKVYAVRAIDASYDPVKIEMCFQTVVTDVIGKVNTMVRGERRLATAWIAKQALLGRVPGDWLEAGVATGGMAVVMKSMLDCVGDNRKLFLADSWEGLPDPKDTRFADVESIFKGGEYKRGMNTFYNQMREYGRYWKAKNVTWVIPEEDDETILKGLFQDTLPTLSDDQRFSFIRCDGDMYPSTMDCFEFLYPKLSCGGWVYVDDFWEFRECRQAVIDYFEKTPEFEMPHFITVQQNGHFYEWEKDVDPEVAFGLRPKGNHPEATFWAKECPTADSTPHVVSV